MLNAINDNNELINSFLFEEESLIKMKNNTFFCPCCKERVRLKRGRKKLKSGNIMITHFSHLKGADCPIPKESYEHLATKISIFNSIKDAGISDVWLERTFNLKKYENLLDKYLLEVKNNYSHLNIHETFFGKLLKRNIFRPDVCFKYQNKNIAVEIQKSYLPTEDFLLRTLFYKILNINVLWVIPDDIFTKKAFIVEFEDEDDYELRMNISDFHKELKKYYFGNIYTWDYEASMLKVYHIDNVTGFRTMGEMVTGEHGGRYFEESGGYNFTYKKLKILNLVKIQNDIINKFEDHDITKNRKYNIAIDAKVWLLKNL